MVNILAIGNSFSQDAAAHLHGLAASGGYEIRIANLYIGGCSLELHHENADGDLAAYDYELNGRSTGRTVSIREALAEHYWNFVTLQQASRDSGKPETFEPHLGALSKTARRYAPSAEQLLHKTWAYETGSDHTAFPDYRCDRGYMYASISKAYAEAAGRHGMRIIPTGDAIEALRALPEFDVTHNGTPLCRDGYHLGFLYGRYAAAAVWYETLLGGDIRRNDYIPAADGETANPRLLEMIRETVHTVLLQYK